MAADKVETPPPAWAREHRKSARALLLAEVAMLTRLRSSFRRAVGELLVGLSESVSTMADKLQAISGVRQTIKTMSAALADDIQSGRQRARQSALLRLSGELDLLRAEIERNGYDDPPADPPASDAAEDEVLARTAADSIAAAWGSSATAAVLAWADTGVGTITAALRASLKQHDFRLTRTATTETARAFNDEHDEGVGYIAEQSAGAEWLPGLFKRWEAMLDRKVCASCAGHDGEIAAAGMRFGGGDEPGEVHANCRCVDVMIFIPIRIGGKKTPGRYTGVDDDEAA